MRSFDELVARNSCSYGAVQTMPIESTTNQSSYYVLLNTRSGTAHALGVTADTLAQSMERHGYQFAIDADDESSFEDRISDALASEHDVIIAAGGDGTASGVASALVGSEKTLAVMPLGTVNSLAKDLSVPLDIEAWVAALGSMEKRRVDVGEVNGRIFLHMVVIGLIPSLAAGRELMRGQMGIGAKIGLLRYFLRRLARTRRLAVQIDPEGETARIERVQSIAISCNPYEEAAGSILKRETLDAGELTLYTLTRLGTWDIVRLGSEMLLGRWKQDEALSIQSVSAVTIRSRKPRLQVMIDGEIESMAVPLVFRIRPSALQVLAHPDADDRLVAQTGK